MAQNKNKEKTIVFRLQNEDTQHGLEYTIKGWGESQMYRDLQINSIESSNKHSLNEPTSIPSPFARIALAKTAFGEVAEHGDNASDVYQKIVSDCLDVAEIFFTFDKWDKQLVILKWDKDKNLEELKEKHSIFYNSLNTFLKTDAKAYNFDRMKCIYMLKHLDTGKIIGATSPCTLFFSSANPFEGNEMLLSNNHNAFSGVFPFSKRSWDFQAFLYTWMAQDRENTTLFPEVAKYLDKQEKEIGRKRDIDNLREEFKSNIQNYSKFSVSTYVEILGKDYLKQKIDYEATTKSDFEISIWDEQLRKLFERKLPLVLPLEGGNGSKYHKWQLTENTKWDTFEAKTIYEGSFNDGKRQLPDGTVYPFLAISDFLTNTIIRLPYKLNTKAFFDGNLDLDSKSGYLLPLKDTFFQFFTIEELQTKKFDGKPMIEMKEIFGGTEVILRIPVKKNKEYVEYSRVYFEGIQPNIEENDGGIVDIDIDFAFALFPNIKFEKEENAFYRFGLVTSKGKENLYSATFYHKNEIFNEIEPLLRNEKRGNKIHNTYGIDQKIFDHIEITDKSENASVTGIIVPKFLENKSNSQKFTFAVDLGTTNTHIEYTTADMAKSKPFDISSDDIQVCISNRKDELIEQETEIDFLPEIIGKDMNSLRFFKFQFPVRTALTVINDLDDNKIVSPFLEANIAVPYQKVVVPNAKTQLKWNFNDKQIQYFIDSLCFMMRNKVLQNKGNLAATKIVWFYPLSMLGQKKNNLEDTWTLAYAKYFLGNSADSYDKLNAEDIKKISENLISLTESEAPYMYYSELPEHKHNISDLISIDIGGGTTDVVFVENKKIEYMTSFRFAANALFGLGDGNMVIQKHTSKIENLIAEHDRNFQIDSVFTSIKKEKNKGIQTADLSSFFFSLSENEILKEKDVQINFLEMLKKDEKQKLVFVLFYAAIIYHIAQIIKAKTIEKKPNAKQEDFIIPRHITFSGNGSRLLTTITSRNEVLEDFSKMIFQKVFDNKNPSRLQIVYENNYPKEVSARGGIKAADINYNPTKFEPVVFLGLNDDDIFAKNKIYKDLGETNVVSNKIVKQSQYFLELVCEKLLKEQYGEGRERTTETFEKALNITPEALKVAKELFKDTTDNNRDFNTWTKNGIEARINELGGNLQEIEETFFFYPLIGFLQNLSNKLERIENQ